MELRVLQKDTIVYRSYSAEPKRDGYWFAINANDTYGYGSKTGEFRLLKDLKLINIINQNFYSNLKEVIKQISNTFPLIKSLSPLILFPLGFEDDVFYREYAKASGVDHSTFPLVPEIHIDSMLNFNNRSRLSILLNDIELMKFLNLVYGSHCDGIISEKAFPDIIRNGLHFAELSVFDNSNLSYVKDHVRPTLGGGSMITPQVKYVFPISPEETNEFVKKQISMADKILEELKSTRITVPGIEFYETLVETKANTRKRKTRKNRK
jgi:hypothetical protein